MIHHLKKMHSLLKKAEGSEDAQKVRQALDTAASKYIENPNRNSGKWVGSPEQESQLEDYFRQRQTARESGIVPPARKGSLLSRPKETTPPAERSSVATQRDTSPDAPEAVIQGLKERIGTETSGTGQGKRTTYKNPNAVLQEHGLPEDYDPTLEPKMANEQKLRSELADYRTESGAAIPGGKDPSLTAKLMHQRAKMEGGESKITATPNTEKTRAMEAAQARANRASAKKVKLITDPQQLASVESRYGKSLNKASEEDIAKIKALMDEAAHNVILAPSKEDRQKHLQTYFEHRQALRHFGYEQPTGDYKQQTFKPEKTIATNIKPEPRKEISNEEVQAYREKIGFNPETGESSKPNAILEQHGMVKPKPVQKSGEDDPRLFQQPSAMKFRHAARGRHQTGVHHQITPSSDPGQSYAGNSTESARKAPRWSPEESEKRSWAKNRHRDVLEEQQKMPRPNLPKSMEKSAEEAKNAKFPKTGNEVSVAPEKGPKVPLATKRMHEMIQKAKGKVEVVKKNFNPMSATSLTKEEAEKAAEINGYK